MMVSWMWVPLALWGGALLGALAMSIVSMGSRDDG